MRETLQTPDPRLIEMDIPPILSPVEIGRIDRSLLPQMLNEASLDPDHANRFMRLSILLYSLGSAELGLDMHLRALEYRRTFRYVCAQTPAIRLLAIMGAGGGLENAPVEYLLEGGDVQLDLLYVDEAGTLPDEVPDHDIAIIAMGESYQNKASLKALAITFSNWPQPVINQPLSVLNCSRDRLYNLLKGAESLVVAETFCVSRGEISRVAFPRIVRPVDAHGGEGLEWIDSDSMLKDYLESRAEDAFYVSDYIDYASSDGLFRKARIALIDGRPYVCHLAISDQWIVHYIPAGMEASEAKRLEERAFMETFDQVFVKIHGAALQEIHEKLQLDYVVLDCGERADGRLVWFEADSRGWIHGVDPVDVFPYKSAIMQKAFDAFRALLSLRLQFKPPTQSQAPILPPSRQDDPSRMS